MTTYTSFSSITSTEDETNVLYICISMFVPQTSLPFKKNKFYVKYVKNKYVQSWSIFNVRGTTIFTENNIFSIYRPITRSL